MAASPDEGRIRYQVGAGRMMMLLVGLLLIANIQAFLIQSPPRPSAISNDRRLSSPTSSPTILFAKKSKNGGRGKKSSSSPSPSSPSSSSTEEGDEPSALDPTTLPSLSAVEGGEGEGEGAAAEEGGGGGISPTMYDKLRSEATTPFRSFRMFVYGGFAAGAGLGGYTAVTQLFQSINHMPDAIPLEKAVLNVGVDVAVFAASAFAWNFENNLKKKTDIEMAKLRTKEPYRLTFDIKKERERALSALPITFQVGENQTMTSNVKQLREKGGQHVIVLAAPKAELADALLGARIAKSLFAKNDVMIAPFIIEAPGTDSSSEGGGAAVKGFGKGAASINEALLDETPYIAKPAEQEPWRAYIEEEVSDAIKQGNENARKKGIGVMMMKDGTIIRRGIGQPEWREAVLELVGQKSTNEWSDAYVPPIASKLKNKRSRDEEQEK